MTKTYNLAIPFVKWVGGKRQLISEIRKRIPPKNDIKKYYEPFVGGGAVFLDLEPKQAVINDSNSELINTYQVIKDNVDLLINDLKKHQNNAKYFYEIRAIDREPVYSEWSNIEKASRFIYLNKTCYNGLYRVNSQGFFNTPFGSYKNPNIVNEYVLRELNAYFNSANIEFYNLDFEESLKDIKPGSFVYFDPPYAPLSSTSNFTGYTSGGFNEDEQTRLRNLCIQLHEKGVNFLLSNSNVELINELYKDEIFFKEVVNAKRNINSKGNKRGEVEEILIWNKIEG